MKTNEALKMETVAYAVGYYDLEIKKIEYSIDDYVIYVTGAIHGHPKAHRAKIYYTDRPYFMCYGSRVHLDDCMKM